MKLELEKFFTEPTQNIAEFLDDEKIKEIYLQVSQKLADDISGMGDKIDKLRSYVKLASLISERDKPFIGASDVVFPLAASACIQYGSTAYQSLFPDDNIAKAKIIGSDKGKIQTNDEGEPLLNDDGQPKMEFVGHKQKMGERQTTMINYQLTEEMSYWKSDAINSMYRLPAIGTLFKKTYWDFIRNIPCSKFIFPDKIIINPSCKEIENNIWTEILEIDKKTIASNVKRGLWLDYDYEKIDNTTKTQTNTIEDKNNDSNTKSDLYLFNEQHTYLDLDDDGIEEPYSVIFDTSAQKIVRITPEYDLDNIKRNKDSIYYIERNECLIYFGFLPDFAGGFYSVGYAELLSNNNAAVNATINQMIDCGHLKIKGGGFISTGIDLRGGALTFKMGEYKKVNTAGGNLAANVFPFPFPDPSPVLFSLLGLLIESGKEIGSLRDVLTGDTAANMAPTTFMGIVEQGMKQSIAILKNNHESFKKELKILKKLNAKYLPDEKYAEIIDADKNDYEVSAKLNFSEKNCDIVLVTDTSSMTSAQKMAQAQLLMSLKDDPFYDPLEVRKMFNEAIQMASLNEIIATPPPSPDANLIFAQAEDKKAEVKYMEANIKAEEAMSKINDTAERIQLVYAEIKLKESEVLKNISEAFSKEKETNLKEIAHYDQIITDRINLALKHREQNINQSINNEETETDSSGVVEPSNNEEVAQAA